MIRGGKSLVSSPPVFSNDATKLLVCTGTSVSVYSTATALQIGELEGHLALVTSVIVEPAATAASKKLCFCWTASLDGTIRFWDYSAQELIKTVDVNLPIFSMVIPAFLRQRANKEEKGRYIQAFISVEFVGGQSFLERGLSGQIRRCNLTKSSLNSDILSETPQPEFITISPCGNFFAIRNNRRIFIWETSCMEFTVTKRKRMKLQHTKNITVLAFHSTERIIAAGDCTGRILVWRGFDNKRFSEDGSATSGKAGVRRGYDDESCSTWHWHSSEVTVLSFSSDGAYLYSGGKEGVLVVWQLNSRNQKFLPRIGSPLLYFADSPDPTLASVSCADNQIHLLQMPAMNILKSIAGIKVNEDSSGQFAFSSSAGLMALRAENYCVQLYSLFDDRQSLEVQVCERNHQPGDDVTVLVTLIALSLDGTFMCTVEKWLPEDEIGGLICLKFWSRESQSSEFNLVTVIYEPHRDAGISAIAFHPVLPMAVSSSFGGDFKIWNSIQKPHLKDQLTQQAGWACHAVGSYKKKPMTAASFSPDGSVLAVAAETVITLWDPLKNVLVTVIGDTWKSITTLSFAALSEFIISVSRASKPQLCVWSLSRLSLAWSYNLDVEAVTSGEDGYFAVLAIFDSSHQPTDEEKLQGRDGVILLFNVKDPSPVSAWSVTKAKGGGISFVKVNTDLLGEGDQGLSKPNELLAYVNGHHEYVLFDPNNTAISRQNFDRPISSRLKETSQFGYASIYGELPEFDSSKYVEDPSAPVVLSGKPWETLFAGSSHNLPSLVRLCPLFLESFLEKRSVPVE